MKVASLTAAVLTRNEAEMIQGCLATLRWCQQILVIDTHSSDETVELAKAVGAEVRTTDQTSFAKRRDEALAACQTEWILYIDADERVTPELAKQIERVVDENVLDVASFPRRNYFFGRQFAHGGWQAEEVTRLFRVSALRGWHGDIHESPVFEGASIQLSSPLWHFSHRSIADGLSKTAVWTPMEAALLAESHLQPVTFWTVLRKGLGEVWRRGFKQAGWKDGDAGKMEVLTQAINRMLVYMQVWERQQQPPVSSRYQSLEEEVQTLWQNDQ